MKILNNKHLNIIILSFLTILLTFSFNKAVDYEDTIQKQNIVCGNVIAIEKVNDKLYLVNLSKDNNIILAKVENKIPKLNEQYCIKKYDVAKILFLTIIEVILIFVMSFNLIFLVWIIVESRE